MLDEFRIACADGRVTLRFHDRVPADPSAPIASYRVTLTGPDLVAGGLVLGGHAPTHPAGFFAELAAGHRQGGWPGELEWDALAHELSLRASHDREAHLRLRVRLGSRANGWDFGWEARVPLIVPITQLDTLALHSATFFGAPSGPSPDASPLPQDG